MKSILAEELNRLQASQMPEHLIGSAGNHKVPVDLLTAYHLRFPAGLIQG